jgi:hypothetical protein
MGKRAPADRDPVLLLRSGHAEHTNGKVRSEEPSPLPEMEREGARAEALVIGFQRYVWKYTASLRRGGIRRDHYGYHFEGDAKAQAIVWDLRRQFASYVRYALHGNTRGAGDCTQRGLRSSSIVAAWPREVRPPGVLSLGLGAAIMPNRSLPCGVVVAAPSL